MGTTETAQHTPGPWKFVDTLHRNIKHFIGVYADNGNVAICEWQFFNGEPGLEPSQANARLIAAAPDLLEACLAAFNAISEPPIDDTSSWGILRDQLSAAIAKAEGK